MELYLNNSEYGELETLGERYQYAQQLWNITMPTDNDARYTVDRADALHWRDVVDSEPHGVFPRASKELKAKLDGFYKRIS